MANIRRLPPPKGILKKKTRSGRASPYLTMNVLFWNIRGIGNEISKKMLRWHCNTIRPDLLCLAEPKVPLENIHSSFWSSIQMNFVALNSRVSGLPKKRVLRSHKVSLINIIYRSEQVIVLELESCSRRFNIAFVYAHASHMQRRLLWASSA